MTLKCTYNCLQGDKYAHTNHNKDNTNIVHIHHTHKWTWRKDPVSNHMIPTHQGPGTGAYKMELNMLKIQTKYWKLFTN